jgi:hypothetical protein
MSIVKDLIMKPISSKAANDIVKKYHYSGKVCQNSQIHFGIFLNKILVGALQFGPSTDKRRMGQSLGIGMNESLELNRMAISDVCGKNTESRALGICLKILKKQYPFLRCIVSFADACQCGDGTIYRAANFKLHSYKVNKSLMYIDDEAVSYFRKYIPSCSNVVARKTLDDHRDESGKYLTTHLKKFNSKPLVGYQMKYIYYFDKNLEKSHPSVPFDKIPDYVKMYKGIKRREHESNASDFQLEESGAIPTSALHNCEAN